MFLNVVLFPFREEESLATVEIEVDIDRVHRDLVNIME